MAPCHVGKGQEKGRVENGAGYVPKPCRAGRAMPDFSALNPAARHGRATVANGRLHGATQAPPTVLWQPERPSVRPIPRLPFNIATVSQVRAPRPLRLTVETHRLSDTYGGRVHATRRADATPSPIPARSRLLQDLGFRAFTLPQVEILRPTKKPRGEERTREQQWMNQALHQRWLRIEHVHRSVKRCRIVKDRSRLWKEGVRDLVMALCWALHNFRVRLSPWQPMI